MLCKPSKPSKSMSRSKPHVQIAIDAGIVQCIDKLRPSTINRTAWINSFLVSALDGLEPSHLHCEFACPPSTANINKIYAHLFCGEPKQPLSMDEG